jgi:hypothetical protein
MKAGDGHAVSEISLASIHPDARPPSRRRSLLTAGVIGHYRGYVVPYTILIVVAALTVGLSIAVA